jgi:hypothetical protein
LDLGLEDILEGNSISGKGADTVGELLSGHLVLVEVVAEFGLVVNVGLPLDVEGCGLLGDELLWDGFLGVVKLLEKVWRDGQIVTTSQLGDFTLVSEGSTHNNGLVAKLLVVVEDALDRADTWVLRSRIGLSSGGLVPIEDTSDEWGDEVGTGLSGGDGLLKREHEGQVGVNTVLGLELTGGLDALPGGGDLDENTLLVNSDGLVEINDVKSLVNRGLLVEGETGINFGGDLSWNDGENFLSELDEESVKGSIDLRIDVITVFLSVSNGGIDQMSVFWLLGSSKDERWVGGGILWLVLGDSSEITAVTDNSGASLLQLLERGNHFVVLEVMK